MKRLNKIKVKINSKQNRSWRKSTLFLGKLKTMDSILTNTPEGFQSQRPECPS